MVHGHEETERCPIYVGPRFWPFCLLLLEKKHDVVCKNRVNIYLLKVLTWK